MVQLKDWTELLQDNARGLAVEELDPEEIDIEEILAWKEAESRTAYPKSTSG